MDNKIFIPSLIKTGLQLRNDTYTGFLAYVIYNDGKVWRKEKSWEGWRQKYISPEELDKRIEEYDKNKSEHYKKYNPKHEYKSIRENTNYTNMSFGVADERIIPKEFQNVPVSGFVLNKKVGDYKSDWNHRRAACRVYDPRGFEFEIQIENLLYILDNATSIKGKGLEGNFVYGWAGTELVLIPEEAPEYKEMVQFTDLQSQKVSKKELVIGGIYLDNRMEKCVYLTESIPYDYPGRPGETKVLWWYNLDAKYGNVRQKAMNNIKSYTNEVSKDYSDLMDKLEKETHYNPSKDVVLTYEPYSVSYLKTELSNGNRSYYYGRNYKEVFYEPKPKKYREAYLKKGGEDYQWIDGKSVRMPTVYFLTKCYRSDKKITPDYLSLEELVKNHPLYKELKNNVDPETKQ